MGKASKWFQGLLGFKKPDSLSPSQPSATPPPPSRSEPKPPKRRWSFAKSHRQKDHHTLNTGADNRRVSPPAQFSDDCGVDPSKHAIAVAAASAAVAEAAVAAAHAAAAVVRLTSSGRSITSGATAMYVSSASFGIPEEWAAVRIQSNFRAYLSRRALRALKALVKLQALVRGHIVRKQTADLLRRMQALVRAQTRARAGRGPSFESSHSSTKSSQFHLPGPATPEKFENAVRRRSTKHDQSSMLKRSGSKPNGRVNEVASENRRCSMRTGPTDDEKSDKILEIDTGKPHITYKHRKLFQSSHYVLASDQYSHSFTASKDSTIHQTIPSPSSCEVQSSSPLKFSQDVEESSFCTADNSPQFYSASSKGGSSTRGPFTPIKNDCSRSWLSGYSDHPNYMAYTESSRAKMRSLSAPRQRPQFERSSTTKRYSMHGYGDSRSSTQRVLALHANFTGKVYPGSGRLDRLGMPEGGDAAEISGGHSYRN